MTFSPDRFETMKKVEIEGQNCRYYQLVEDDENKPLNAPSTGEDDGKKERVPVAECNEKFIRLLKPVYDEILTDENRVSN